MTFRYSTNLNHNGGRDGFLLVLFKLVGLSFAKLECHVSVKRFSFLIHDCAVHTNTLGQNRTKS